MLRYFSVRKRVDEIEKGLNDPEGFSQSKAKSVFSDIFKLLIAPGGIILILTFLWGYTNIFGDDSGFARFVFWILLILNGILFMIIRTIMKTIRGAKRKAAQQEEITSQKDVFVTYDAHGQKVNEKE